ncbi:hypothetical protein C5167_047086 [Papaver somniferum]|uniref:Uncharacterized protein n=1 Tax=Papaver somniferum TaxID=3469 RepID=A0A4Y7LFL7_PAPSO|nr:protein GRAVITROPIC IN THE LIGHT 1-like isoform X1 [Papaver somniferum]RZC84304.1 hypothetical protein C5167_047086 [Papaver somniferum]
MSMNRVSSISDLIHRVATSCLQNPLTDNHHQSLGSSQNSSSNPTEYEEIESENEEDEENGVLGNEKQKKKKNESREIEELMSDVFESISVMKKAYVKLQQAHSPWDQEKMSVADIAVVSELRKLGMLKERFRRRNRSNGGGEQESGSGRRGFVPLREVVAPYEAAMDELKKQVKTKDIEIENLEQKLQNAITTINTTNGSNGKRGKFHSRRRVSNCSLGHVAGVAPGAEQFESTTSQMKEASKSFTALLLSLMRSAGWDIDAAVRSIESASPTTTTTINKGDNMASVSGPQHAKYALESYISQKMFHGFDHETFYIDGSLSSLLNPDQFRKDCFTQFQDMKSMEPTELLGISPTCTFGKFCTKKFLSIVHPKMEESLFGNLEHHELVSAGNHPRSQFYGDFLKLAKSVWLLHLLAFSLDPPPCHFQASKGAEFRKEYMESVVRFSSRRMPVGLTVGFPVSPGFKLGNGSVIKARVYLVSRT